MSKQQQPVLRTIATVVTTYKTSVNETKKTNYETFTLNRQSDRHWYIGVEHGAKLFVADYEVEPYLKMLKQAVKHTKSKSSFVRGDDVNSEPLKHTTRNIGYSADAIWPEKLQFDKDCVSFSHVILSEVDGKWVMGDNASLIFIEQPHLAAYIVLLKKAKKLIKQQEAA